jgi:GAF domain-containing protein
MPPGGSVATPSWNEADRFGALLRYQILDTPPEPDFDNITRVAALVCKAPIAVVNLIADTRQWFKSEIGLGVRETPLDVSICAKAILQPGLFVVPDTTKDPRFDCNPLVTGEPYLRFYAGARLDTPEGLPLGTVCILDYAPRPEGLTGEQAEILLALARQTMTHLELRKALEAHDLLSRELNHRIQNILTVVSGLAALTARGNAPAQGFVRQFRARLDALARANNYVRPRTGSPRLRGRACTGWCANCSRPTRMRGAYAPPAWAMTPRSARRPRPRWL